MNLVESFSLYKDEWGMTTLTRTGGVGNPTDNGALFTLEYLICLIEDETTPRWVKSLELVRLFGVFKSLEVYPGLTARTPISHGVDSMDNNTASLAFSAYAGGSLVAKRIKLFGEYITCHGLDAENLDQNKKYYLLARVVTAINLIFKPWTWASWVKSGVKPRYFWNVTYPNDFCFEGWFGRSPGFLGLIDLAATGWTTPFRWLSVLVGQFLGCFANTDNTDARKLPYVAWFMLTRCTGWGQRWFWKLAYRLWVFILLKQYPNGMRSVYQIYYEDRDHPIRVYSKKYFKVSP